MTTATINDPRWPAIVARDRAADGRFFYAVRTTGIYCRPSCPSRRARPGNVRFFDTREAAERAGFRACRRCRPDAASPAAIQAAWVAAACRQIEAANEVPTLATLAARANVSPYHFHRTFRAITGVTPKQYAAARRGERLRSELSRAGSVTDAIYGAGYNSNGRFYEEADAVLGMTASAYRAGGAHTAMRFAVGQCSLGAILVAASARGICAILLGDDPQALTRQLQDQFPKAELIGGDADFERVVARVVGFVESPGQGLGLPLDVRGTAFQRRVWQALRAIPAGETASYREIAERIGAPKAVRAVGQACGANHLAVAIPCHRVVRTDGDLSGYRWGIERKRTLLAREADSAHPA
ncbi:MAG: Bifunctional transcriptional activator/DNA repair enzyme Ada [Steroidobacteraceae bacterium]|nr:Bifunctional transcriptional activator/DNA repair enzyme Ada [Steroidobacteraceae bacterium]